MAQLTEIVEALEASWNYDTAFNQDDWTPENPARGHCVVSSLIVQDYLGGELLKSEVTGSGLHETHYFNKIDDGTIVDATSKQYSESVTLKLTPSNFDGFKPLRDKRLSDENTKMRYAKLKNRVESFLGMQNSLSVIDSEKAGRRVDYLYRISLKGLIRNEKGEVLVVKETGRDWWDLPGGGMDHGEGIQSALAREMKEEVNLEGDFSYSIIAVDEPSYLHAHNFWQVRLIYQLNHTNMEFSAGDDADEIKFINPDSFKDSASEVEHRIYKYVNIDCS